MSLEANKYEIGTGYVGSSISSEEISDFCKSIDYKPHSKKIVPGIQILVNLLSQDEDYIENNNSIKAYFNESLPVEKEVVVRSYDHGTKQAPHKTYSIFNEKKKNIISKKDDKSETTEISSHNGFKPPVDNSTFRFITEKKGMSDFLDFTGMKNISSAIYLFSIAKGISLFRRMLDNPLKYREIKLGNAIRTKGLIPVFNSIHITRGENYLPINEIPNPENFQISSWIQQNGGNIKNYRNKEFTYKIILEQNGNKIYTAEHIFELIPRKNLLDKI